MAPINTLSQRLLSSVDSYTRRVGFINSALTAIVEKIAPRTNAAACGNGVDCYYWCGGSCGGTLIKLNRVYADTEQACNTNPHICLEGCYDPCFE